MKHRRWITVLVAAVLAVTATACNKSAPTGPTTPPPSAPSYPDAPTAPDNVAVLVIDDFTSTSQSNGKPALTVSPSGTCTLGTNEVGTHGAGEGDLNNNTHGAAVYGVLQERLDEIIGRNQRTPAATSTIDPPAGPTSYTDWKVKGATGDAILRLIAVNTTGWTTQSAIDMTRATIKQLHDKFKRIVMNLSFVTIPCDPTEQFKGTNNESGLLAWYNTVIGKDRTVYDALVGHDVNGCTQQKCQLTVESLRTIYPFVISDPKLIPLRDCLVSKVYEQINQELNVSKKSGPMVQALSIGDSGWNTVATEALVSTTDAIVVPVGAAGNGVDCEAVPDPNKPGQPLHMSPRFPFAPALWDFVVSASATNAKVMPKKADYANSGEVVLNDGPPAIAQRSYGTSYSAPRLSAVEAMYLVDPGKAKCNGYRPTLGYVDETVDVLPDLPDPGPWKNMPWPTWHDLCQSFDPHQAVGTP
jgi:hypothetical protein